MKNTTNRTTMWGIRTPNGIHTDKADDVTPDVVMGNYALWKTRQSARVASQQLRTGTGVRSATPVKVDVRLQVL